MLPLAYVCHHTVERLRVRIPEKRGDEQYFAGLKKRLHEWDHALQIQVTPLTGSLLLENYESHEFIKNCARNLKLFSLVEKAEAKKAREALAHPIFIGALVGLGTLQLLRGQALAAGSTLFMDALRLWTSRR